MRVVVILLFSVFAAVAQDPKEILRKSVQVDQLNWSRMRNYTWVVDSVERKLDSAGKVKSTETEKWETLILGGEPHGRMLEKNGKPLSASDQRKEQEKLDKLTSKLANETPAEREKRVAKQEKQRLKEREFALEIPEMFDLKLEGDQKVDGHDVWVISATPKAGYQPKNSDSKFLQKVRGKLWIDQKEYHWVRLEAETIDLISFGLFLARLHPGAKVTFEQTRVNDEIWLPKRQTVKGSARLGLVKKLAIEQELTWHDFRKFQVDSKIVSTQATQ